MAEMDMQQEQQEEWRDVVGWEGLYSVSNCGRVRSNARVVIRGNGVPTTVREKILRPCVHRKYQLVNLRRNRRGLIVSLHRLVAAAFLGPSPLHVLHIDNNPANNCVGNLRYGTQAENIAQAGREGRMQLCNGVTRRNHKITVEQAGEIIGLIGKTTQTAIAQRFGISQRAVSEIAMGRSWREHPARRANAQTS